MNVLAQAIGELVSQLREVQVRVAELEWEREQRKGANRRKLMPNEVQQIRRLAADNVKQKDIAEMFCVNPATVSRIVSGVYH